MKTKSSILAIYTLILVASVFAQKASDKPFEQWSKDDAIKLLSNSPWARTYQPPAGINQAEQAQLARERATNAIRTGNNNEVSRQLFPRPPITMRLHSGLPVRQAIVRLQQIEVGYDKMDIKNKEAFDAGRQRFLDCAICQDFYVVTISRGYSSPGGAVLEQGVFQGMTLESLKGNVKLVTDKGAERDIIAFNSPQDKNGMAVLYFKRNNDADVPMITPEVKNVKIVFTNEFLSSKNPFAYLLPRSFDFKVDKLVIDNSVVF